jgi:hypothetical protein
VAAGVLVLAAVAVLAAGTLGGSSSPSRPRPVRTPAGPTPAAHAHNLAHWIRGHTG